MMEFSPDFDARWCYLVVLACALLSARLQIYGRLDILKERTIYAWGLFSTWVIYTVYLAIPLALFWFLDRTGALHDTSFFGALLVGLAYPAILSGGTSIKATDGLAGVFGWLNKSTDVLVTKTTNLAALKARIYGRAVVNVLSQPENSAAYERVKQLAADYSVDPPALDKELQAAGGVRATEASIVYDYATSSVQGLKPLARLLPTLSLKPCPVSPYTIVRRWAASYFLGCFVTVVIVIALVFSSWGSRHYFVWRICKQGVTAQDLQRTRAHLQHELSVTIDADRERIDRHLINALYQPGLEIQRADEILRLLLQFRGEPRKDSFTTVTRLLVDALRVSSVDIRARVHLALRLLASEFNSGQNSIPEDLANYQPLKAETPIDLEKTCRSWKRWWDTQEATVQPEKTGATTPGASAR